nr:MAG TPA: hypothetical protein [Bacteriophage sp.]
MTQNTEWPGAADPSFCRRQRLIGGWLNGK